MRVPDASTRAGTLCTLVLVALLLGPLVRANMGAAAGAPDLSRAMPHSGGGTARAIQALQRVPFKGKFSFIFMGDNRNGAADSTEGDVVFRRLLRKANEQPALFAFDDGDLTYQGAQADWDQFGAIIGTLKFPMITAIGNHDVANRSYYEKFYTPPNAYTGLDDYSFDYGNCRFVVLDNASFTLTDRQLTWLEAQLSVKKRHKFVGMHIPPFFNIWGNDGMKIGLASLQFFAIVSSRQVDYVLLSHIHVYDDSMKLQGVQYLVSGGAGAPLTKVGFGKPINHFVRISIDGDRVKHTVVPV